MREINKDNITRNFRNAASSYHGNAIAQMQIAGRLCELAWPHIGKHREHLLEVGAGTGLLSRIIIEKWKPQRLTLNDLYLNHELMDEISGMKCQVRFVEGDAESIGLPEGTDAIFSSSAIQWFADTERFISRCAGSLRNSGLLCLSSFEGGNLKEIRQLTGIGLEYMPFEHLLDIIARHCEILESRRSTITLWFDSPRDVLRHLSLTGVTFSEGFRWTPEKLRLFERNYIINYTYDGKVSLTYCPVYIIARKL